MIFHKMLASLAMLSTLAAAASPPAVASDEGSGEGGLEKALYGSRLLWATVDVCNPKDHPDTIGVRGSMPSDGHRGDTLFMRFRVQYLRASSKQWVDLAKNADSGYLPVHAVGTASQAGRDFQLVKGAEPFTLRGVVGFQWRRGKRVVYSVTRTTTAGHESLAGAEPADFSAATCTIA